MKYSKLSEKKEPVIVDVIFPVEKESGEQSEITLTILFDDELLLEEILEASQCDCIIGMINEKLPTGTFLSDIPTGFNKSKNPDIIDLKVHRNVELY
jgi:hypothetical protein